MLSYIIVFRGIEVQEEDSLEIAERLLILYGDTAYIQYTDNGIHIYEESK